MNQRKQHGEYEERATKRHHNRATQHTPTTQYNDICAVALEVRVRPSVRETQTVSARA